MSLPLMPAPAGDRAGRRIAGAALLLLLMALVHPPAAVADTRPDPYSITVKVDATADNVVDARRKARLDGQRDALTQLVAQLSGSTAASLPKLDDSQITNLVDSFEVADEHMSAVRYLAEYTFHFRPARVRRLMHDAGIAMAQPAAKPAIVLPVFEDGGAPVLWGDPNPWREAWAQHPAGSGHLPLLVPLGGMADLKTIDAPQALAGDAQALGDEARQNGGDQTIVALATTQREDGRLTALAVTTKRYRDGHLDNSRDANFTAASGEGEEDLIKRAVTEVAAAIENGGSEIAAASAGAKASLTAIVPIAGLDEWVRLREKLAKVPAVRGVDLLSLNRRQAKIEIDYSGTPDQLKSSLAAAELELDGGAPMWRLAPAGTANPH